ncbi:25098_t:CDS:2 [Gigaspora margarita]|uniref:25098_t:CDS:1 n=1 Tax=Gigaspora margarita TaxID=4874 RepID=A0ABN7XLS0_GIGMA|nr:25098_t:CDS:2 [Gigaspora margarita]
MSKNKKTKVEDRIEILKQQEQAISKEFTKYLAEAVEKEKNQEHPDN